MGMLVREIDLVEMRAVHRTQVEVLTLDIGGGYISSLE
jgi:hypothetical protein